MIEFLSECSFWIPEWLVESGWIEHAPFAFWLFEAHQPRTFVELGTHRGYSYFAFNQAARAFGTKTRCFAIDTWTGDEHAGLYGDEIYQQVEQYNRSRYEDYSELIRSTFEEAAPQFEDGSIDLLHIDGRHFYTDVRSDFENWRTKLSDRGIVLFHDTNVRARDFGVYRLWDELKGSYPHFEFLHGHGLGVLSAGASIPPILSKFFDSANDPVVVKQVRTAYASLGRAISDHMRADSDSPVKQEIARLEQTLAQAKLNFKKELAAIQDEAHTRIGDAQNQIEQAQARVEAIERERDQLARTLKGGLEQQLASLKQEEAQKRAMIIERFGRQLDELRSAAEQNDKSEFRALEEELEKALAQVTYFRGEYELAVKSRSWQMTRPLRDGSAVLGRLKKALGGS